MRVTAPTAGSATPPAPRSRRRLATVLTVVSLLIGLAAVTAQQLLLEPSEPPAEPARPLSQEEAERLASMRERNYHDGGAGVRATISDGTTSVHLAGWVDWRHPVVYLARSGSTPGVADELLQAVPGLVAYRPGSVEAPTTSPVSRTSPDASASVPVVDPHPLPPVPPPADGWQVRPLAPGSGTSAPHDPSAVDSALALLLNLTSPQPDSATLLANSDSRWLRPDRAAGYDVDVLLGPAIPPVEPTESTATPVPQSLAAMGGAVQYWLDRQGRLHQLAALLSETTTLEMTLDRSAQPTTEVLDLLGGDPIQPAPVSWPEAELLARLGQSNYAAGGGEVVVTVPNQDGTTFRARGWLDWQRSITYLISGPVDDPLGLVWADREAVGYRPGPLPEGEQPPLPAPADGWQWSLWTQRGDEYGGFDVDLLLNEALNAGGGHGLDPEVIHQHAYRLRSDTLAGKPVTVYEIQRQTETEVSPGQSRLRYWVDDQAGILLRLEIRTRSGGFGQLDLTPAPVPYLY